MIKIEGSEYSGVEKTIKERIAKMPEVIKVDSIFGRFDIIRARPRSEALPENKGLLFF